MKKKKVLFLCAGNSCRSQMAEGYLRYLGGDRFKACSAGTKPVKVNPLVVEVMKEEGIGISGHRPKLIKELPDKGFDCLITVCDQF